MAHKFAPTARAVDVWRSHGRSAVASHLRWERCVRAGVAFACGTLRALVASAVAGGNRRAGCVKAMSHSHVSRS